MVIKRIIAIILAIATTMFSLALVSCSDPEPTVDPINDNYRTFYQIFVGSFSDSNGDGFGDIRGIINRMDYLNDGNINSGESTMGEEGSSWIITTPNWH